MLVIKKYGLKIYNWKEDAVPDSAVNVGCPSTYANPWHHKKGVGLHKAKSPAEATAKFREYTSRNLAIGDMARRYLKGKDLVCSCQDENCHAVVVMDLANEVQKNKL